MKRSVHVLRSWLAAWLSFVLLVACGGPPSSSSSGEADHLVLQSLQVTPATASLPKGLAVPLTVSGRLSNGTQIDLTGTANWTSSNTAVASVDGGILSALGTGTATITATVASLSAQAGVEVTAPALLVVDVEPPSQTLAKGLSAGYRAYGRYTDGSRREITAEATWSTADALVAEASGVTAGRAAALATGATAVQASLAGVSAHAQLTVTDAVLASLEVFPATAEVAEGTATALKAIALYSDNTSGDVTTEVAWQSSNETVTSVDSAGKVAGAAAGAATVTASLGGFSAGADITVTDAVLVSLDIAPSNASVTTGHRVRMTATGGFSDGTRQDLSRAVQWSSSDDNVAAIEVDVDGGVALEALTPGAAQVTADLGGVHAAAPLQVKARVLTAIAVAPAAPRLALGSTLRLGARGDFDDGSSQVLGTEVTWESQAPSVAVVDANGVVTSVAPGSVRLSASRGDITGSVLLTVTGAVLDSLEVVLDASTLAAGSRIGLAAVGHYSDGSTQDLTGQVLWSSSDWSVAEIRNGVEAEVMAGVPGTATLSARFGGVAGQQTLTVTNAVLVSLDIGPAAPAVVKGATLSLSAVGHFSDASQQDMTGQVVWSSSDPAIARVSNVTGNAGLASGMDGGNVSVTAALGAVNASTTLSVLDDPQAPVALTVLAEPNVILGNGSDNATLTVTVLAAESGATVADGTVIHYQVLQGNGVLAAGSAATVDGQATVTLSATVPGLIVVEATVDGVAVGNDAAIFVVDDFAEVLAVATPFSGTLANGVVEEGARFGLFVFNLSNREFTLDRFRFSYAGAVRIDSDDPLRLNQNRLPGGAHVSAVVELANDFPNDAFSGEFLLRDSASGRSFNAEGEYSLSE